MFRTLLFSAATLAISSLAMSSTAFAHPEPKSDAAQVTPQFTKPQLPSQAEITRALDQMPDMNAIMGDMMSMMKDEKLQGKMKSSAEVFAEKMKKEDVFKKGPDGMPDFNNVFATMLGTLSDEKAMGGIMETMQGLAETMDVTMQKHIPEDAKK